MIEENICQEFRSKNIDEIRSYFVEETHQNEFLSNKHKKFFMTPDYLENFLILVSVVTGCISIFAFASLIGITTGITSSVIGLKINVIASGIRKY